MPSRYVEAGRLHSNSRQPGHIGPAWAVFGKFICTLSVWTELLQDLRCSLRRHWRELACWFQDVYWGLQESDSQQRKQWTIYRPYMNHSPICSLSQIPAFEGTRIKSVSSIHLKISDLSLKIQLRFRKNASSGGTSWCFPKGTDWCVDLLLMTRDKGTHKNRQECSRWSSFLYSWLWVWHNCVLCGCRQQAPAMVTSLWWWMDCKLEQWAEINPLSP